MTRSCPSTIRVATPAGSRTWNSPIPSTSSKTHLVPPGRHGETGTRRQHARRSAGFELVHQSHRRSPDADSGAGARRQQIRSRGSARVGQVGRDGGKGPGGRQPGFRAERPGDPGQMYQLEVDPLDHPRLATGAELIGSLISTRSASRRRRLRAQGRSSQHHDLGEGHDPRCIRPAPVHAPGSRERPARRGEGRTGARLSVSHAVRRRGCGALRVLRNPNRRSQRSHPARASPRAARQPRVRRVGGARRLAWREQPQRARQG